VSDEDAPATPRAELKIINPDATPEEIAALVAVFSSLGTPARPEPKPTPAWAHHRRKMRIDFRHGRGGWRASGLPQ
jgi:hypothetical protein